MTNIKDLAKLGERRNYKNKAPQMVEIIKQQQTRIKELEEDLELNNKFIDSQQSLMDLYVDENGELIDAAQDLYDNRLGCSDGRNPYAQPEFWEALGKALANKEVD